MSEEIDGTPAFNRATRVPLEAVVRLHFEGEVSYQNGFSANVSATGMFVKHPEPHPIGSKLVFEFLVGSQRRPVQGTGMVTWIRARYEGPGKPAGMGIYYEELDYGSRDHLTQALFEYLEESVGGEIAAVEEENAAPATPAGEPFRLDTDLSTPEPTAAVQEYLQQPSEDAWDLEAASDHTPLVPPEPAGADGHSKRTAEPTPELGAWSAPATTPSIDSGLRDWHSTRELLQPPPAEPAPPLAPFAAQAQAAEPARPFRWQLPAIALTVVAVGAGAAWWFLLREPGSTPPPPARPSARPTATYDAFARPQTTNAAAAAATPASETPAGASTTAATAPATPPATPTTAPAAASAAAPDTAPNTAAVPNNLPRFGALRDVQVFRESGATVVELRLDGSIGNGDFLSAAMPGENPRLLVKLRRARAPYTRGSVGGGTAELRGIRTGYHEAAGGNEIHVVLDLAASDPRRAEVTPSGDRLFIRLPGRN